MRHIEIGTCQWCKREFIIAPHHILRGQKYCSRPCFWKGKVGKTMKNKGRPLSLAHRKKLSGSLANAWRGGVSSENEIARKRVEYRLWRAAVFLRDNYTCQMCGKRGGTLNADHIKPFAYYPDLRYAIDNGRTLCFICHIKTDTWGGRAHKYAE